jgi:hypothetical protein
MAVIPIHLVRIASIFGFEIRNMKFNCLLRSVPRWVASSGCMLLERGSSRGYGFCQITFCDYANEFLRIIDYR